MGESSKCSCCGTEKVQIGEFEITMGDKRLNGIPAYNIQMITQIKGRNICEDCMDKYMYIDAIMTGRDASRGGVRYFGDGRERDGY